MTDDLAPSYEEGRLALLRTAESAVAANDDAEALRRLLEAWRALADARLPAVIERLRVPATGATKAMTATEWHTLEAKRDPRDLPLLLGTLVGRRSTEAAERLEKISAWHRDPLIASTCAEWLIHPPLTAYSTQKFYEKVITTLELQRDPHANASLQGYKCSITHRLGERLTRAVNAYVERAREPAKKMTAAEHAILDRIALLLDKRDAPKTSLLEKVYESPSDDGARIVYGDWLIERGDPRGTFITLQLMPERRGKEERAMARLLKEYASDWLGPLSPILTNVAFERGFPVRGAICGAVGGLVDEPGWATFERLVASSAHGDNDGLARMLAHPRMKVLRSFAIPVATAGQLFEDRADWSSYDIELYGPIDTGRAPRIGSESLRIRNLYLRVGTPEAAAMVRCVAETIDLKGVGWKLTITGRDRIDASYELELFLPKLHKALLHLVHRPKQISIKEPNVQKPLTKEIARTWPSVQIVTPPLDDSF